jgi:2-dehydropantoate 2-reductase
MVIPTRPGKRVKTVQCGKTNGMEKMATKTMRIAVVGVGAVGGLMAARLASTGHAVSAVARGPTLQALREQGLRLQQGDAMETVAINAVPDARELGPQDLVIMAVKATALRQVAAGIAPLLGPQTAVLTAMNGVPWWFFAPENVPHAGTRLASLDPDGALLNAIPARHVLGCVVHLSSASPAPGLVRPGFGNKLIIGEPGGGISERVEHIAGLLREAQFDTVASGDIRTDIWYKLWGNMTMNPVSAMTGATCDRVLDDPLVNRYCLEAMAEAAAIGARIGCPITQSGEERMAVTRQLGVFKTSMLQDAEAGRPLEIDALLTAVHEIGRLTGLPTPTIDSLLGLARLYGRCHGLYPS